MITKLYIENFRSIEKAEVDLGKITVLTGANNSGKSSVIYALLALRNVVTKPNQNIDNLLTLPFINLGGFEQVVYMKNENESIKIGFMYKNSLQFSCVLNPSSSSFNINAQNSWFFKSSIPISFPYTLNKEKEVPFIFRTPKEEKLSGTFSWTGLTLKNKSVNILTQSESYIELSSDTSALAVINFLVSIPISTMDHLDFVPIRRGFTQPYYSPIPLSNGKGITEEEIATIISFDRILIDKIAFYLEKIVDRYFSIYTIPNTAIFYLQTRHRETGFTADLVNEGLGTNQLVTLLAKVLQSNNDFVCIDEPEIHLHPSVISKLVGVLVEIAEKEGKQFLISTHSEHFITALLKHTHQKDIKPEDVKVYYLKKEGQKTVFEHQAINDKGQIEGGLVHFYETELEDLSSLFKLTN